MPDPSTASDFSGLQSGRSATVADPSTSRSLAASSCQTCGSVRGPDEGFAASSFVYAVGRLEPRFPTIGVEKELAQAIGKAGTASLTDREAIYSVLSQPEMLYLVRQLCWTLTIESTDAYVITPRDVEEIRMLVGALRPTPRVGDIDVVVGWLGPLSDGRGCNGIRLPMIHLAQLYSFDARKLARHLSKPKNVSDEAFGATVEEVLQRVSQIADNMGVRDDHRAVNYLITRDELLYGEVAKQYAKNYSLGAVRVDASPLSGPRRITEVILEFRDRETDVVEKRFVTVDVSDVFPFKMSKWAPYTDRR